MSLWEESSPDIQAKRLDDTWAQILTDVDGMYHGQCRQLITQQYADSYIEYCFGIHILLDSSLQPCFHGIGGLTHDFYGTLDPGVIHDKGVVDGILTYVRTGQPLYRMHRDLEDYRQWQKILYIVDDEN